MEVTFYERNSKGLSGNHNGSHHLSGGRQQEQRSDEARVPCQRRGQRTACARVVMEGWHGMNFVDFHHLMKTEDGWKIVSKIYTQI